MRILPVRAHSHEKSKQQNNDYIGLYESLFTKLVTIQRTLSFRATRGILDFGRINKRSRFLAAARNDRIIKRLGK